MPEQVGEKEKTRLQLQRGGNQAANGIAKEQDDKGVKLQATLPQVRSTKLGLESIHLGKQEKVLERKGGIAQGLDEEFCQVSSHSSLRKVGCKSWNKQRLNVDGPAAQA